MEEFRSWTLKPEEELRVQAEEEVMVTVRPRIASMAAPQAHSEACGVIEVKGKYHAYVAGDTPMIQYVNVHHVLQGRREEARKSGSSGPRVMVVGGVDVGKSTICKILSNYAARAGEKLTFVDLDVGQGDITVPGMLAARPISQSMDVERGFEDEHPIVFFYGDVSPSSNVPLLKKQTERLAAAVQRRMDENPDGEFPLRYPVKSGGMIINTCGWVRDLGYEILLHNIQSFSPDVILVVAEERLFNDLKHDVGTENVDILKISKSGGVVSRDQALRKHARTNRVKDYFYGEKEQLSPNRATTPVARMNFYEVKAPLPIGMTSSFDPLTPVKISPNVDFVTRVFGISREQDPAKLLEQSFDSNTLVITYLRPSLGPMPGKNVILSKISFID